MKLETKIAKARQLLKDNGYYVDNLWHINDVKNDFDCSDEEAYNILNEILDGEYTVGSINDDIAYYAGEKGLTKKQEEE